MGHLGFFKNKVLYSPIANQSTLRPKGGKTARPIGASLMLTSLVDAFSILVIFLMMNSATQSSDIAIDKAVELPKSETAGTSFKTTVLKLSGDEISINGERVSKQELAGRLRAIRKKLNEAKAPTADALVIVADKDLDYVTLNPLIVSGSRAGFSEFRFAVEKVAAK